ncbi:MAG: phage capsid protein [Geminicoccaceae bacterium]|jgi:hypothetical protein|nr:phage capsid protein [Geminicoccaceae bacterium]
MSYEVPAHFVQQYTTNVQLLLQQRGSKLRGHVTEHGFTGKAAKAVEQVGAVTAVKRTSRHADTPLIATPADARWCYPDDYGWADLIDDVDKLKMLIDPQSSYALNGSYAIGRSMDDAIIAAATGVSKAGENGTTSKSFLSTQEVAASVGSTTGMNHAKVRKARELLEKAEVDVDNDPLTIALSAVQAMELFGETITGSVDYVNGRPIVTGKLPMLYGFEFVCIERLAKASNDRWVLAFAKSGLHLGIWDEISTEIDRIPGKWGSHQVMVKGSFGAVRSEEKKIVRILSTES